MKQCSKCKELKDKSLFNKHRRSNDGLNSLCKECNRKGLSLRKSVLQKKLETSFKKLDYLEFQSINGLNTCICKKCGEIKPRHTKDGDIYLWICKKCHTEKARAFRAKSKYKGVNRLCSKYQAKIHHKGKTIFINSFKTEIEAAQAYNNYVIEHNLNRPLNIIPKETK